jgi:hypothetical protein
MLIKVYFSLKLYLAEKMEKHKNDPNANKTTLTEYYREQWKNLVDKKKMAWINVALEDEHRYQVRKYHVFPYLLT